MAIDVLFHQAMLKQVFRSPGSMPEFFIYDNCCGVYNHLLANKDPLAKMLGCPVDVFLTASTRRQMLFASNTAILKNFPSLSTLMALGISILRNASNSIPGWEVTGLSFVK